MGLPGEGRIQERSILLRRVWDRQHPPPPKCLSTQKVEGPAGDPLAFFSPPHIFLWTPQKTAGCCFSCLICKKKSKVPHKTRSPVVKLPGPGLSVSAWLHAPRTACQLRRGEGLQTQDPGLCLDRCPLASHPLMVVVIATCRHHTEPPDNIIPLSLPPPQPPSSFHSVTCVFSYLLARLLV